MNDLKPLLNAVRLSFSEEEKFTWQSSYRKIVKDSHLNFPVRISYEIVGSFLSGNKISVITRLREFSLSEEIFKAILKELEDNVIQVITHRTPETYNQIEIIFELKQKMLHMSD